jgi:hypothetical protein
MYTHYKTCINTTNEYSDIKILKKCRMSVGSNLYTLNVSVLYIYGTSVIHIM